MRTRQDFSDAVSFMYMQILKSFLYQRLYTSSRLRAVDLSILEIGYFLIDQHLKQARSLETQPKRQRETPIFVGSKIIPSQNFGRYSNMSVNVDLSQVGCNTLFQTYHLKLSPPSVTGCKRHFSRPDTKFFK